MIQLYIYISISYSFFHILFYYGLSQDIEYSSLCSTVRLLFMHSICNTLHLLISDSQSIPPPPHDGTVLHARVQYPRTKSEVHVPRMKVKLRSRGEPAMAGWRPFPLPLSPCALSSRAVGSSLVSLGLMV